MKVRTGISMLVVLLCVSGASFGDSYDFSGAVSTEDMYKTPTGNPYGTGTSLYLGGMSWVAIQFDLPSTEAIDSVTSASVTLTWRNVGTENVATNFNVWRLTETFDEANPPTGMPDYSLLAHDTSAVVTFDRVGMSDGSYFTLDVANLLSNNGDSQTFGIIIQMSEDISAGDCRLWPHESASGGPRPDLAAVYTTVPEPATMGLLTAGFAALSLRRRRK